MMEYRELGRTGLKAGVIGIGCEGFLGRKEEDVVIELQWLMDQGCNLFEMYTPDPAFHRAVGKAVRGRRDKVILQAHIGSVWKNGEYLRTRDMELIRKAFPERLEQLGTDYVDIGMIHFADSEEDWRGIYEGPVMEYVREMKKEGKIRHIGLSTHSATTAMLAAGTGEVEVILFSVNPCYDMISGETEIEALMNGDTYKGGVQAQNRERRDFYEYCERNGIAIDIMKAYGGGDILSEKLSPFGKPFTPVQCLHYALTRPAAVSVCPGCKTKEEWKTALSYSEASEEEKDYVPVLSAASSYTIEGHCMYCGHCAPCTKGIRIWDVTKYLNLALAEGIVPETVADHYRALAYHGSDCIQCGVCESRCPFKVAIIRNMQKAEEIFGI
jgi:predicted aldo/keto reductase-like oxidoreductase